jgi:hypothetical protein
VAALIVIVSSNLVTSGDLYCNLLSVVIQLQVGTFTAICCQ